MNDDIKDFLSFRKMITMSILKYIYIIGGVIIFVAGMVLSVASMLTPDSLLLGALLAIFGTLVAQIVWRLACEGVILLFSMHDILSSIERHER